MWGYRENEDPLMFDVEKTGKLPFATRFDTKYQSEFVSILVLVDEQLAYMAE